MGHIKKIFAAVLLSCVLIFNYTIPVGQYEGTDFISQLKIPLVMSNWQGRDVTDQMNLDSEKDIFKFISKARALVYRNRDGEELFFIVLDASNFHHPRVCYTQAGFSVEELDDAEFQISNHKIKAHALSSSKESENLLSFYWIIIDKNISHQWIEQKVKQLYFSLFDKKRIGLMARVDIPSKNHNFESAQRLAGDFLQDLSEEIDREYADYVFGKL